MTEELEKVRNGLRKWIRGHAPANAGLSCEEVILLAGNALRGFRFAIGDTQAVWNIGDTTAEIRSPAGTGMIILDEEVNPARTSRAA